MNPVLLLNIATTITKNKKAKVLFVLLQLGWLAYKMSNSKKEKRSAQNIRKQIE